MRIWAVLSICALLAGCTLAGPEQMDVVDVPVAEGNPVTGDAIAVTSLDAPAASGAAAAKPAAAAVPAAASAAKPAEVAKPAEAAKPADSTKPADPAKPVEAEAPAEAAAPEEPAPPPMSAQEQACVKKGGTWAAAGKSGARACVKTTHDSGKHCSKASDCEGACLARSNTCAPINPMFGCNDILQDNGAMVTLCID